MPALLSAALLRLLPCSRRRYAGGGRHEQTAFGGFYIIDEQSGAGSESLIELQPALCAGMCGAGTSRRLNYSRTYQGFNREVHFTLESLENNPPPRSQELLYGFNSSALNRAFLVGF
uniref:Uncharacterized protein n=2 Tax=Oryza TaxID=4527 RepID=A0A0D3GPC5_9ORYZ